MELISRQQAIDALENDKAALDKIIKGMSAEDMLLKCYVAQHNQVSYDIDAIVQLPPIQPEIVRCKDCKYARLTADGSCKYCDIWFPDEAEYMDGDYYCASAERKSNG